MRKLLAKDLAPFTKVLAKMELKPTIKSMFSKKVNDKKTDNQDVDDKSDNGEMVSELIWGVVENYHKAEQEFYTFLANLEGKTSVEIAELELAEFIGIITELFSEKNMPFFKLAAK